MRTRTTLVKYRLIAPVYDLVVHNPLVRRARRTAFDLLGLRPGMHVLLAGVGTGEDLPFIPAGVTVTGIDVSAAMLAQAARKNRTGARLLRMDAEALTFPDASFDAVALNLVLAVAEKPRAVLAEALRVLKPGGRILVFDKFVPGGRCPGVLRRALNLLTAAVATDITRRFEDIAAGFAVRVVHDECAFLGCNFRIILLRPAADAALTIPREKR